MTIDLQLEPKIASRLSHQATLERSPLSDAIVEFCQRWQIEEFYLFGSVLRDDFRPDSDIDVMVKFSPDAHWALRLYPSNMG